MSKTLITNAYTAIVRDLNKRSSKVRKIAAMRYFKTGKGQYGEGDEFIGVTVPDVRKVSLKYAQIISEEDIKKLLKNNIHEYRLAALMILDVRYTKARKADDELCMKHFFTIYMSSFTYINNWDLVDQSARDILGHIHICNYQTKGKSICSSFPNHLHCGNGALLWLRVIIIFARSHLRFRYTLQVNSLVIPKI